MCAGESLQALRRLRAPKLVRAIGKDFGQVAFRYDAAVLFGRRSLAPSRDVLGFPTVGLAIPDW